MSECTRTLVGEAEAYGTAVYGVFWDSRKDNGLGDIEIRNIDLLNLFWEPGITDIQKSRNLFIVDLVDNGLLDSRVPPSSRASRRARSWT